MTSTYVEFADTRLIILIQFHLSVIIQLMGYSTLIKICVWIIKIAIELIYTPIHIIRIFQIPRACPPVTNDILLQPASVLAEKIRKRKIKSEDVIRTYISRINEVNPIINAVIEDRFQDAIKDAEKADDLVLNSGLSEEEIKEKYPLLGVPITIKGSIAVAGIIHSAGRVDHLVKAPVDAICVSYARNAGAIPLLTSNVPELCLNWESTNKLIGTTGNPYNNTRTAGGSSGGEASLIGSGASLIGVGSDIAGSLRWPAHCCGVWGHKPSPYTISTSGHYPDCKNKDEWRKLFTLGPMARYAPDLKFLLNIIAEPEMKKILKLDEKINLKKIKVYYMEDINSILSDRNDEDVLQVIKKVIKHLDGICDVKCTKARIPLMKYCTELSYLRLLNVDDVENIFEGRGEGSISELFRFLSCRSNHTFSSIGYGLLRNGMNLAPAKSLNAVYKHLEKLRNDFIEMLGDDGIFITPTNPKEATYHGDLLRGIFNYGCLSVFNALGFPATNCPITFSKNGLPLGIQVVAAPNLDRLTLAVAEELEKAFGGWKPIYRKN